jgi:hypothetical protein
LPALCLLLLAACSGSGAAHRSAVGSASATTEPTGRASRSAAPSHIFLIVMENRSLDEVVGSPNVPFTTGLAARYGLETAYFAVAHPSLPNYLALIAGDTFGVTDDCEDCFQQAPTLVDQLERAGRSWKAYMEDLPAPCSLVTDVGGYALKHDPFLYFTGIRNNPQRCRRVVPFSQFQQDLAANSVPAFAWITPNLTHDTHDSDVTTGDAWLAATVPQILASPAWQQGGVLILTWDEGEDDAGCCGSAGGGRVATLVIAPHMRPGARSDLPTNHFGLLRALEDAWGLPPLGHAATANGAWLAALLQP